MINLNGRDDDIKDYSAEDDLDDNDDLDGVKDDNDPHPHTDCSSKVDFIQVGYHSFPQLLPAMIAKGKGAIINIASFGNFSFSTQHPANYLCMIDITNIASFGSFKSSHIST